MPQSMLADDIRSMRDHIAEYGWHQGDFTSPDDPDRCCLLGAAKKRILFRFSCLDDHAVKRYLAVVAHLAEMIRQTGDFQFLDIDYGDGPQPMIILLSEGADPSWKVRNPIPYFNDKVLKDKAEVLAFLDKAAIAAEEKA